ncbi:MAG: SUMF1/EgtB/PvdO family nonheme iron enzyme [Planctomycetes bacterium]|nr:SUMF1/EgtB/PvdO family nonheme iron enzyme [Planctomycetota bacterium]
MLSLALTVLLAGGAAGAWFYTDKSRAEALEKGAGDLLASVNALAEQGRFDEARNRLKTLRSGDLAGAEAAKGGSGIAAKEALVAAKEKELIDRLRRDWDQARERELARDWAAAISTYTTLGAAGSGATVAAPFHDSAKAGLARVDAKKKRCDALADGKTATAAGDWAKARESLSAGEAVVLATIEDDARAFLATDDDRRADGAKEQEARDALAKEFEAAKSAVANGEQRRTVLEEADLAFKRGQWEEAGAKYAAAKALGDLDAEALQNSKVCEYETLLLKADAAKNSGKFDEAAALCDQAGALAVNDRWETAKADVESARKRAQFDAQIAAARAMEKEGKFDDAIAAFRAAEAMVDGALAADARLPAAGIADCTVRRAHAASDWDGVLAVTGFTDAVQPLVDEAKAKKTAAADLTAGMVAVPAGLYKFGDDADPQASPAFECRVEEFLIDAREVTNAQYREFVKATGRAAPKGWDSPDHAADDQPVVGVTWEDARAYAAWKGKRLPTELEFEAACRGGAATRFPWGDEPDQSKCNGKESGHGKPLAAGATPANGLGIHDLSGNVEEWTSDFWQKYPTPYAPRAEGKVVVVRGGSYAVPLDQCRPGSRSFRPPGDSRLNVGFRCALTRK